MLSTQIRNRITYLFMLVFAVALFLNQVAWSQGRSGEVTLSVNGKTVEDAKSSAQLEGLDLFLVTSELIKEVNVEIWRDGAYRNKAGFKLIRAFNVNAGKMIEKMAKKGDTLKVTVTLRGGAIHSFELELG